MSNVPTIDPGYTQAASVQILVSAGNNVQPLPNTLPAGAEVNAAPKPTAVQTAPQAVGYATQ